MFKIPYVNLSAQWEEENMELLPLISNALASGQYINGLAVQEFEKSIAELCNTKNCVALNSGTDALVLGLVAMGIKYGDEIITPPNSFIASTAAIAHIGAIPVFVDVLPDQNLDPQKITAAITNRTKAVMPVHLTGRMAKMDEIKLIADKHGLNIIEDAAQAFGSRYNNLPSGKWGKVGCFSAHPLKNLNACGDSGFVVTDDEEVASKIMMMRNHGLVDRNTVKQFGYVSRMDEIQAVILNYRIKKLPKLIERRRKNAALYYKLLDRSKVVVSEETPLEFNTYHTFVIQSGNRDELKKELENVGIETSIHYPVPIHLQPAAKGLGYTEGDFPLTELQSHRILTLPINQYLTEKQIVEVSEQVNKFSRL